MLELLTRGDFVKIWLLDGKRVAVYNDYDHCGKCGRRLKSERSRALGFGPECLWNHRAFRKPIMKILIAIPAGKEAEH